MKIALILILATGLPESLCKGNVISYQTDFHAKLFTPAIIRSDDESRI